MLKGKTALITGGARGIGAAITATLAAQGANVAVIYAGSQEKAEALCAQCAQDHGVQAQAYQCDVADFAAAKAVVAQVKKDFGAVDILVNNAGITQDGLLAMMKEESFDRVLDVDLKGAFNFIRHCTPLFLRQKGGAIVNITSVSGMIGNPGQANYAAAKAGLIGLTKAVAKELAPKGITCNAVAPGFIATDMTRDLAGQDNALLAAIPLGRMGQPQEVAQAVAFLATAPYITGEVLRVEGCCCILFTGESDAPDTVRQLLLDEIERVRREGVDREIFTLCKNEKYGQLIENLENVEDSASQMADFALSGQTVAQQITMLAGLTAEDADAALQHILSTDRMAVMDILPDGTAPLAENEEEAE